RGSAGVDVHTAVTVVLDSAGVHRIPLDATGPLGKGLSALLIGRSSATLQGIFVHPGVIDADFTGQNYAMVSTPSPPVAIPAGTQIAQLVPFYSSVLRADQRERKDDGFGSTGPQQVFWTMNISDQRPQMMCTLTLSEANPSQIQLRGLIDTGADVTVIS
ncbi:POK9 protein, partial [Copsychus sechellarum]|nr:POK9 protein [Copsychus sechellarum]